MFPVVQMKVLMGRRQCVLYLLFLLLLGLNTALFVTAVDGSDLKPLPPHADLDYDTSFSLDARPRFRDFIGTGERDSHNARAWLLKERR